MRYLFYIIIFMLLLTVGVITLATRDGKQPPGDYIAKVNGHYIMESDLAKGRNVSLDAHDIKYEFINSLITKEVLIHEAMERKIDQEETFRQSVKNFYEQSLIKALLDRQQEKLPRTPTEADISAYLNLHNKMVKISLKPVSTSSQGSSEVCQAETIESLFQNLAFSLRMNLLHLHEGDMSEKIDFMGCSYTIRLDTVSKTAQNGPPENPGKAAALIEDFNREQLLRKWIADLVQKAHVEVNTHKIEEPQ
jgi:hypothetical protein